MRQAIPSLERDGSAAAALQTEPDENIDNDIDNDDEFWLTDYGADNDDPRESTSAAGGSAQDSTSSPDQAQRRGVPDRERQQAGHRRKKKAAGAKLNWIGGQLKIPAILIAIAIVIFFGIGFTEADAGGAAITIALLLIMCVFQVAVGIATCYLAASLLDTGFGDLKEACVKLTAIMMFPTAVSLVLNLASPFLGYVSMMGLFYGLLMWMFDLDFGDAILFVILLWTVQFLAVGALAML